MEETSEELPNFSIGIDHLGPDLTTNKIKLKKLLSCTFRKFVLITSGLRLLKHFLSNTLVHLALIFSIFPVHFELFSHSYQLTG